MCLTSILRLRIQLTGGSFFLSSSKRLPANGPGIGVARTTPEKAIKNMNVPAKIERANLLFVITLLNSSIINAALSPLLDAKFLHAKPEFCFTIPAFT